MAKQRKTARATAALIGAAAIVGTAALPGSIASAENSGDVTTTVTRAVLIQGNANAEINRATLITQINADGNGTASFTIPVVAGGSPKNMDGFGGPEVVDGAAQYNLTVNGSQVMRTSQDFDPADIPVSVRVEATLDGQPMAMSDLAGATGLAKVKYTFTNDTAEPTQLTYEDAMGNEITEEAEIPVPMAGQVNITFPGSWGDVTAPTATTVSGDGTGNTLVSATIPLLPDTLPDQNTTGSLEIEARLSDAVVPPADIKFAVIPPARTPDLQQGRATAEAGEKQAAQITDAGTQIGEGAGQLQDGLATAADGANKIADGVSGQLGPGVTQLSDGLNQFNTTAIGKLREAALTLPETVRSNPSFSQLTDGFDSMNAAVSGVKEGLGVYKTKSSQKPGSWIKKNGDVNTGRADVARTLWSLIYGTRQVDIPSDSKNPRTLPGEANGGLTNPACSLKNPEDPANPCGAWQVANALKEGLETAGATLGNTTDGGAFAFKTLANSLGCKTTTPAGYAGPVVGPAVGFTGNPCSEPITVGGSANCTNPFQDKLPVAELPCNLVVNALLGGVDLQAPLPPTQLDGLTQSFYKPLDLADTSNSGLTPLLGVYMPIAIGKILENVTTSPTGIPDLDTTKANTATGIVMQTRNSLALGGVGKDLYPGHRCEGYARPGDPSSGVNEHADQDRVKATCAAADVLTIAGFASAKIEDGVSTTLLEGIAENLLAGVGSYAPGCEPTSSLACASGTLAAGGDQLNEGVNGSSATSLKNGTRALADGLPAAVEGAGKISEGGFKLQDGGNDGSKTAGVALATLNALQARADAGGGIPGGAPEGVTQYNGVYAFALNGAGGSATENAARAGLGFLALIAAGGVGAILGSRASG